METNPLVLDSLARSTAARLATIAEIDHYLEASMYRDSGYGLTELRDILLDLRKLLDVVPR